MTGATSGTIIDATATFSGSGGGGSGGGGGTNTLSIGAGSGTPGSGTVVPTGIVQYVQAPYSGIITGYSIIADQVGSIAVGIWKSNLAVPTSANSIVASAPPALSSSQYINSTTLTGWTTTFAIGDVFAFNVNSASGLDSFSLQLYVTATSGGGLAPSVNNISSNTAAGSTSGTYYIYFCTGTITVTLPTAIGNANLYTIKNVGTGMVTIATTSSQTIDGVVGATLPNQYQSVDLISNNSNWDIV